MVKMLSSTITMVNKQLVYIILFFSMICSSQTTEQSLVTVLNDIEARLDVKFSYAVEDVFDVRINTPSPTLSLNETLNYLNQNTLLNFQKINDRYITVSVIGKTISVCGVIQDANGKPLFGATIAVQNMQKGAVSDINGQFQLKNIDLQSVLEVSFLGFENKIINAKTLFSAKNECQNIHLIESKEVLNQVLITKFLTTGLQKRIDGSTTLNTEAFGILPGLAEPDILQSIQALPGVESVNESIANINVRGGTNDQNLMLWDGIKMYHSGHFFGLISAYNPNLTHKVVVTKNGTSAAFSDGVSSTIDMQTKNEIDNKFSGGFGANLISADAFLELPITKNLELHVSGRRSFTDVFSTPTYNNYFKRSFQDSELTTNSQTIESSANASEFLFYDYSAKILFNLNENHRFRANSIQINNKLKYTESFTNNDGDTESKTSFLSQENLGFGGEWLAKWGKKWSTKLSGYYTKYNVDANDYRVETNQRLTQVNEVLETGTKLNIEYNPNQHIHFLLGYQFTETGILNETTVNLPSYERTKKGVLLNHAMYSEVEYHKNKTYLRTGVRANYFQKFDKILIEPRLNFRQKLNNFYAVKVEGEFKNQSATQIVDFQDDFLGVENRRWILANNNDIPIATSKQASFGLSYNKRNWHIDITGFYKVVNGITASNQGFYNNFQYLRATGQYDVKGVEFLINKTTHKYSTWLSYTYSTNNYTFNDFSPSTFPNNVDIRHSLSAAINYDILKNLKISLGGNWRTGQPYTKPLQGNETVQSGNTTLVNYGMPNNQNLEDYFRLDTSLSYDFKINDSTKAILRAGVINVTDKENIITRYYKVDSNNTDTTVEVNNTSLGITPNVSFRIEL